MIYLNCAATSMKRPPCVIDAVAKAMAGIGSSGRGAADDDLAASRVMMRCRMVLADLLGAERPERVVFCANATQALNTALFGLLRPGDRVVTTVMEHNSVLRPLNVLARDRGVEVHHVGLGADQALDLDALEREMTPGTRLVVCTHASNLTGDVVDITRVARRAHEVGALLLVDAAQTAGALPIDMRSFGIDVLCFTGHKALMGPQGTGGLVAAPSVDIEPLVHGGTGIHSADPFQPVSWPDHLEAGTANAHGLAGLAAAASYVSERGLDAIAAHGERLRSRFVQGARAIPGLVVHGALEAAFGHTPTVALNLSGMASSDLADMLAREHGIATRAGLHCAPLMHRALGTEDRGAVRFSFGCLTTDDEVDAALSALEIIARRVKVAL